MSILYFYQKFARVISRIRVYGTQTYFSDFDPFGTITGSKQIVCGSCRECHGKCTSGSICMSFSRSTESYLQIKIRVLNDEFTASKLNHSHDLFPVPSTAVPARLSDVAAVNFPSVVLLTRTVSLSMYSPQRFTAWATPITAAIRWKNFILQKMQNFAKNFSTERFWRYFLEKIFQIQCFITLK